MFQKAQIWFWSTLESYDWKIKNQQKNPLHSWILINTFCSSIEKTDLQKLYKKVKKKGGWKAAEKKHTFITREKGEHQRKVKYIQLKK